MLLFSRAHTKKSLLETDVIFKCGLRTSFWFLFGFIFSCSVNASRMHNVIGKNYLMEKRIAENEHTHAMLVST